MVVFLILVGNYQTIYAAEQNEVDVIIGYENEIGKELILEQSNHVEYMFQQIPALSVTMEKESVSELQGNPNISYVRENKPFEVSINNQQVTKVPLEKNTPETEYWNINLIGADKAWLEGYTGKGVKVGIIDTGISNHSELTIAGGVSTVEYTSSFQDDHGHGTHVAGVIAGKHNDTGIVGVSPDANLYAIKALDQNGEGNLGDVLEGIEWAVNNGMDIINLSFGMEELDSSLEEMVKQAYEAGILIVGASGNNGRANSVMYPAKYENVIGVSAVDGRLNIAPFSSTGSEVEFSAPGYNIISTFLNGSYGVASGTSQAAPHVAGMLALLKEKYPALTHIELRKKLIQYVQDLGDNGKDSLYGHGFITYFPDDQTAPSEISNLETLDVTEKSAQIRWTNPTEDDFKQVAIYLDDEWIDTVSINEEATYKLEQLEAGTEYNLLLKTEDHLGNVSEGLAEVIKTTTVSVEEPKQESEQKEEVKEEPKLDDSIKENKVENLDPPNKEAASISKDSKSDDEERINNNQHSSEKSSNVEDHKEDSEIEESNREQQVEKQKEEVKKEEVKEELEASSKESTGKEITKQDYSTQENDVTDEQEEVEKEDKEGFFEKISNFIVNIFVSFFNWLSRLFS